VSPSAPPRLLQLPAAASARLSPAGACSRRRRREAASRGRRSSPTPEPAEHCRPLPSFAARRFFVGEAAFLPVRGHCRAVHSAEISRGAALRAGRVRCAATPVGCHATGLRSRGPHTPLCRQAAAVLCRLGRQGVGPVTV
jgi:hypothetical protein